MKTGKKLCKSEKNKMLFGVCGGISEFMGIDVTVVRVIAVVLGLVKGFGLILYLILAFIMPAPVQAESYDENIDDLKSANINGEDVDSKSSSSEGEAHTDEEFDSYFKSDKKD